MTVRELIGKLQEYPPDTEVWMEVDAGVDLVGGLETEIGTDGLVIHPKGRDS